MTYFYIFKDGKMEGRCATRESAINMIRQYQKDETHYILKAEFTIIEGKQEETIPYEK